MQKIKINVITEFDKTSDLEINEFINNLKESFENVVIISIENLPIHYSKFYNYEYRVKFYHDLFLIV
jgi:hypothetical protein